MSLIHGYSSDEDDAPTTIATTTKDVVMKDAQPNAQPKAAAKSEEPQQKKVKLPSASALLSGMPASFTGEHAAAGQKNEDDSDEEEEVSMKGQFKKDYRNAAPPVFTGLGTGETTDWKGPSNFGASSKPTHSATASSSAQAAFGSNKRSNADMKQDKRLPVDAATQRVAAFIPPQVARGKANTSTEDINDLFDRRRKQGVSGSSAKKD
eukprot:GDKI01004995.1.p1 GENE.GDKI01004995.1~~GDKI01004995.1.p1  ORF type:complete len:208 (+),score=66.20 GDKI01004995.1:129-752(+)